jgi:hypothetical protein
MIGDVVALRDKYTELPDDIKALIKNPEAVSTVMSHANTYIEQHSGIAIVKTQEPLAQQVQDLRPLSKGGKAEEELWSANIPNNSNFKNFLAKAEPTLGELNSEDLLSRCIATQKVETLAAGVRRYVPNLDHSEIAKH